MKIRDRLDTINFVDVGIFHKTMSTFHLEKFPFIFTGMQVEGVGIKGCNFTGNSVHYLKRLEREIESDPYIQ